MFRTFIENLAFYYMLQIRNKIVFFWFLFCNICIIGITGNIGIIGNIGYKKKVIEVIKVMQVI